ncbi:MAG TPA: nitroreductase [Bryobacteraceae bacterium]|nr:nitroreductase [Bryobacteraceae bacterium]
MTHIPGAIAALLSRASTGELAEPGPDEAQLHLLLEAAVRAPDHGKLRPWRFYVIRGEARHRLSELFAAALLRREPQATAAQIEKERGKPLRSPVTIAVVAKIVTGHKIPPFEQVLSTAAAAMNILNAAHGLGFGAKWVTGANCYDPQFGADFGIDPDDQCIGFIHIGTPRTEVTPARPDPADFISEWR